MTDRKVVDGIHSEDLAILVDEDSMDHTDLQGLHGTGGKGDGITLEQDKYRV